MWKISLALTFFMPILINARSVIKRDADETTTHLSLTTADGKAMNATINAIFEGPGEQSTKESALPSSTTEEAIRIDV